MDHWDRRLEHIDYDPVRAREFNTMKALVAVVGADVITRDTRERIVKLEFEIQRAFAAVLEERKIRDQMLMERLREMRGRTS